MPVAARVRCLPVSAANISSAMAAAAETKTPAAASLLTAETVPAYLAKTGAFGPSDAVTAKAIVGGNVNYAFQVGLFSFWS